MTGTKIVNVVRVSITREAGDIVFQPLSGRARYFLYYLPNVGSGRSNYPKVTYPEPEQTAQADWLDETRALGSAGLSSRVGKLPAARIVEFQAIDEFEQLLPDGGDRDRRRDASTDRRATRSRPTWCSLKTAASPSG